MTRPLCLLALFGAALLAQSNQTGIAHVAFRVTDLEAARAFYNKLGFEQFFEMKSGEKTTEAFLKVNDHQFIELYPRTTPDQPLGLMHVCYESINLDDLHAEYVKRGLTVSDVRKAGAGNMLMTMKDPEGQVIEYTMYMPGSRHYEDRGKHLGAARVADTMTGATSPAHDAPAIRAFYTDKLSFTPVSADRLRMPGDSGQQLEIPAAAPTVKSGVQFSVPDLKTTAATLKTLGFTPKSTATALTIADPDGDVVTFIKK
jgi:catechol 2,3-dioxygenase-like lactoylglutathione lyase family enzyme